MEDQLDKDLEGLCYLLRVVWTERGWRTSVIELRDLGVTPGDTQRVATILYNDYKHLMDNGLQPLQAISTVLDHSPKDQA